MRWAVHVPRIGAVALCSLLSTGPLTSTSALTTPDLSLEVPLPRTTAGMACKARNFKHKLHGPSESQCIEALRQGANLGQPPCLLRRSPVAPPSMTGSHSCPASLLMAVCWRAYLMSRYLQGTLLPPVAEGATLGLGSSNGASRRQPSGP